MMIPKIFAPGKKERKVLSDVRTEIGAAVPTELRKLLPRVLLDANDEDTILPEKVAELKPLYVVKDSNIYLSNTKKCAKIPNLLQYYVS